jgi:5-methylthioadenosine/S-adenosylhomocysteine deaminase
MGTRLLEHGTVVTVDGEGTIYDDGAVLIEGEQIRAVGPTAEVRTAHDPDTVVDASGTAILPGFVNLHVHSGFIRGLAEDLPVFEWLTEHVDPTHRALTREDARTAYELCYAEMATAGITCALDMYRYMEEAADVATEYGFRAVLSPYVADREGYGYFESLEDNVALVEDRHGDADGRIRVWFALEHLTYCTPESYEQVAAYADRYDVGIHTHGEESAEMANEITADHGMRPVEMFHERGILGPKTVLAHCVWLTDREIDLLASTGTHVAHCPTSNEKLASGVAPVPKLRRAGVNVGLGTDGIKENNRLDVMHEMKNAALLQKVHNLDATVLTAEEALWMGTLGGARALGLDDEIGSLEPGKRADVTVVDLESPHLSPVLGADNVVPNLVHAAVPSDVDSVYVDGRQIVSEGNFLPADEAALVENHTEVARDLVRRRDAEEWAH